MAKVIKPEQLNRADLAVALGNGGVLLPMLGGYCVLSQEPESVRSHFGHAHRLVLGFRSILAELDEVNPARRGAVMKILAGPVVGILSRTGQTGLTSGSGVALATEPLARSVLEHTPGQLWLGIPDEPMQPGALIDELGEWLAMAVVEDGAAGPGPTVIDFTQAPVRVDRRGRLAILEIEKELGEPVRLGPEVIFSVLVVCTGNSCRSPMAAGYLAKLLEGERVLVGSAGTAAPEGSPPTAFAVEVAAGLGVDISGHRARQLTRDMILSADLILVMERQHRDWIGERAPEALPRVRLLSSYRTGEPLEIFDPVGRPIEVYQEVMSQMQIPLERIAKEIGWRLGTGD
ncbi:MAG: hypothetical protein ABIK44_05370 [candidate division WOR-3 bacterium]